MPKKTEAVEKAEKAPKKLDNSQFAVIETGGKQYKVSVGETVNVEKLGDDLKEGDKITFDKVLLVDDGKGLVSVGTPHVAGAKVEATFKEAGRAKKVIVMKYKAKSRYQKKNGHRQPFSKVLIVSIK